MLPAIDRPGAAWKPELTERWPRLGRELRAAGAHQALSPILDITRDPRWGRIEETYGEDPYLAAVLGGLHRGLQGGDGPRRASWTMSWPRPSTWLATGSRTAASTRVRRISERANFATSSLPVRSGRPRGRPALGDACLRRRGRHAVRRVADFSRTSCAEWGFDGIVVSDYAGIDQIDNHGLTTDKSQAAALRCQAGVDVELPRTNFSAHPSAKAVAAGGDIHGHVDAAVDRVLRPKFELGLFEALCGSGDGGVSIREGPSPGPSDGRQSMSCSPTTGCSPCGRGWRNIAVIGPNADSARNIQGDYAHQVHIETIIEMGGFGAEHPRISSSRTSLPAWRRS